MLRESHTGGAGVAGGTLGGMRDKGNLAEKLALFDEHFSP
jgi:hypothetical protein